MSNIDYGDTMKQGGLNTDICATSTGYHIPGMVQHKTKNTKNMALHITEPHPVETYKSLKTK